MTALAKIHIAKKQLGLDDDDYRAVLQRVTGKTSSKDMSNGERGAVLDELKRLGFKSASTGTRRKLEGRFAPKLQALWIAGWNLGLVRDRSDAALIAFVKRQTGVDHVRFLRHEQDAYKAIEALKGWMHRGAGVDWSKQQGLPAFTQADGYRIALAQWVKINANGSDGFGGFQAFCEKTAGKPMAEIDRAGWIEVMNRLGRLVRNVT